MAFFNFRRDGSNAASNAAAPAPETVDVVRRRAKHRLIGSAVLVLAGVIGFPLLFDTQPRPVAVDIPIEIPGKGTVKPLVIAPPPAGNPARPAAEKSSSEKSPPEKIAADASLAPKEEILSSKQAAAQEKPAPAAIKNEAKPVEKPEAKAESKVAAKTETRTETKPASKPAASDDSDRAGALLNGASAKPSAPAAAADARLVVQVGAFADADKAREARVKLEKAGLKTYTQVAETKDGRRTRVRVGPFANKADAEKAASKIKSLDLPAAILTL
jgi:DedD protein